MSVALCFASLLILLSVGVPIGITLGVSGILGFLAGGGFSPMLLNVGNIAFNSTYSYTLLAVVGFILMGELFLEHKIGMDMYDTVYKWLGHIAGGLGIASTVMGALFGFMCGSSTAGAAVIGGVSLPEMEKRHYERRLALGTLAIAGSLAVLIPPSNVMIIYGVVSEASIGRLFIAGIIPGFLLTALMCTYFYLRVKVNPSLAPPGPSVPWRERFLSLGKLTPVLIMFIVVIGGIYMGVWSAIEAGSASAVAALIICLAFGRVKWSSLKAAGLHTVSVCTMVYTIIIGATIFAYYIHVSGVTEAIKEAVLAFTLPPWAVIVAMGIVLMILGCFVDVIAMLLISVPIFLPIIIAIGYDPVWFGVITVLFSEMAMITPPVGINMFVIKGIAPPGTTLMDVSFGAAPYVGIIWLAVLVLTFFPQIVLWLPSTMMER